MVLTIMNAITVGALAIGLVALARFNQERGAAIRASSFTPFKTYGDPSKPTLVIIPGLDGATIFFMDVIPELTPFFHVLVFNLPLVTPPLTREGRNAEPYNMAYIARNLAEVLDEAGVKGPVTIVGESFGGMVAQRLTLDFPEKVERLVLLSSVAKPEPSFNVKFKLAVVLPVLETIGYLVPFFAQCVFAIAHLPEVVESHEPLWVKHLFLKEASWADHWSVMARIRAVLAFDSVPELGNIKTGALVMFGEEDTFTGSGIRQLLDGIVGAQAKGLPGGHICHVTNPKTFSKAVVDYAMGS